MSDAVDDLDFYAEQLLNKSKTNPLRQRMEEFVSEYGTKVDFKQLRAEVQNGEDLSELVSEGREERL